MKIIRIIFGFVLLSIQASAQSKQKPCPCSILLQESIKKVSTIYAGFDDKVTIQTRARYNQLVKNLKTLAIRTSSARGCYEIIKQYTDWFKDGHVGIWFAIQSSAAEIRKANLNIIPTDFKPNPHSLEGFWSTADQKQQYAIIKDPSGINKFIAIILATTDSAWKPGMVKAEFYNYDAKNNYYWGLYYQRDFHGVLNGFTLNHERLDYWFGPSWYRKNASANLLGENLESVQFKILNKSFTYLKLGRFNQPDVDKLDSFIRTNSSIIHQTKNLIIDLRANSGGNANTSEEMIRLIYTSPIIYPAWQYRSSPELIKSIESEIVGLTKEDPYHLLKSKQVFLENLKKHPGELVSSGDSVIRKEDSTVRYPQRIALLVDKRSASSSEFFVFECKQSKKVTIFGTNTAGGMDYGDAQGYNLFCGEYNLGIPRGRNGWIKRFGFRIDNIGFAPDVRIPQGEDDWVGFVMTYWSK